MSVKDARQVVERAASRVLPEIGHPFEDHLSFDHGFLPRRPPIKQLPGSHAAWDQAAASLPDLHRRLRVCEVLSELPHLSADEASLDAGYLQRAATVLGCLAHAYGLQSGVFPAPLPTALLEPWTQVAARLNRPGPCLSFTDFVGYNWRLIDPLRNDPMRVENLTLLVPLVGNQEEHRLWTTMLEFLAQATPILGAAIRAQEAAAAGDFDAVETELLTVMQTLQEVTFTGFMKISPNPNSQHYTDPIVTTKTTMSFAGGIIEGELGLSGASSPIFHFLDAFFGRKSYDSKYGKGIIAFRPWLPPAHREVVEAVESFSLLEHIQGSGRRDLEGLFFSALTAYAGEKGYLGVHRLKLYTYIELGVKGGRSGTNAGFEGTVEDRSWEDLDVDIDVARRERFTGIPMHLHQARKARVQVSGGGTRQVVLDVQGTGLRYEAGDRVGILPRNSAELIDKTLAALRATGDEPVKLTSSWTKALGGMLPRGAEPLLSLRDFLTYARIRPLDRETGKALLRLSGEPALARILDARAEDQVELWDVLELVGRGRYNTRRLWKAEPWEPESIARIVPPSRFRMYSISSAPDGGKPSEIHLTISPVRYESAEADGESTVERLGAASAYLISEPDAELLTIKVFRPSRFSLPSDPTRPVIMFSAGTGVSPFRSILQERARTEGCGPTWLLHGARTRADVPYPEELAALGRAGKLSCRVALSREDLRLVLRDGAFLSEPAPRGYVDTLLDDPEITEAFSSMLDRACIYVCGQSAFAHTALEGIQRLLTRCTSDEAQAKARFRRLVADGRLMMDIFTTFAPATAPGVLGHQLLDASEVARHNNPTLGYWLTIRGFVYDMSEFLHLHPGGNNLLIAYAGSDATRAYRTVEHHLNSEVDAMLDMYKVGQIRRLDFEMRRGVAPDLEGVLRAVDLRDAFRHWMRYLFLVVECENTMANEWSMRERGVLGGDAPQTLTPYKLRLLLQTHRSLATEYLDLLLGDRLHHLWLLTAGMFAQDQGMQVLREHLERCTSSDRGAAAGALEERLLALPTAPDFDERLDAMTQLVDQLREIDAHFLSRVKDSIRMGIAVFEQHEARVGDHGDTLVEALIAIPVALEDWLESLIARIAPLAS